MELDPVHVMPKATESMFWVRVKRSRSSTAMRKAAIRAVHANDQPSTRKQDSSDFLSKGMCLLETYP